MRLTNIHKDCCCCSVAHLHLTLREPRDCSPSGSFVNGIFHTRILELVAIFFSRGSSRPRDQIHISCCSRQVSTIETPGKPPSTEITHLENLTAKTYFCHGILLVSICLNQEYLSLDPFQRSIHMTPSLPCHLASPSISFLHVPNDRATSLTIPEHKLV